MTFDYPFTSLQMNGRLISLADISSNRTSGNSPFEEETFAFIHAWMNGAQTFHLQTSGSTGTPKQIEVTREQMIASAKMTAEALKLKQGDIALLCMDTKYVGAKMMIVRSFVVGMRLIAVEPSANPLEKISDVQCVNFAAFVPYQIKHVLGSNHPQTLEKIEKLIIGGSAVDASLIKQLQNLSTQCYATYGMTETISHVALQKLNGSDKQQYFHSLPGIELQTDERGCLMIRTPFLDKPIITNDVILLHNASEFEILGRVDNVINSGGIKISSEKLEASIKDILDLAGYKINFFIHWMPDDLLGQKVVLVVEASSHTVEYFLTVHSLLAKKIDRYMLPRLIVVIPSLQYTDTGKLNRLQSIKSIQEIIVPPASSAK